MLERVIDDGRAWQANTIDPFTAWYYTLSKDSLKALDQTVQELCREPRPLSELPLAQTPCAAFRDELRPALHDLEHGRGFVILRGLPQEKYSAQEFQAIYWLVGQMLGRPFAQNVQGTLLYDVRDTGQDVRYGARFSVTNAESTFHTDNSFGEDVLDYVGLLCINKARSGGLNQVVSGYAVHNRLLQQHPEELAVLYQPFHVDRRGGVRPGEAPTIRFPVFAWNGRELIVRYLRYWIEVGHEKAGQPLTAEQQRALDVLDQVASAKDLQVEFGLLPGDMFFINNRWILHNRSAFEDHAEPERKRHLVRLWLQAV
jgi:alpha-ketoglutarate-dependent taurine dioxygenase